MAPVKASRSLALNVPVSSTPSPAESMTAPSWTAIVPLRSLTEGKSRLTERSQNAGVLIEALAIDVLRACRACPGIDQVVVVSPDPAVHELARAEGCSTFEEPIAAGINQAIAAARDAYAPSSPVIAILGDAPCLTPEVLTAVLTQASQNAVSFVPDTAGTGSTMWCTQRAESVSHFGSHSRAHHRSSGAVELGPQSPLSNDSLLTWARARRDVDTKVDLWDALRIGAGAATSAAVRNFNPQSTQA